METSIDDSKDAVARGIESAASSLHDKAEGLPGGERVADAAHAAAAGMEKAADYVRDQDLDEMLDDMQQVVKRHPGITLLAATAVGFLLARLLARD